MKSAFQLALTLIQFGRAEEGKRIFWERLARFEQEITELGPSEYESDEASLWPTDRQIADASRNEYGPLLASLLLFPDAGCTVTGETVD